ncbi:MAG: hypothetical protein PHN51_12095 [Candidatus Nanopelagicales bacterium]|nr:hypothetical protein [Candidatus Nanopelagicales bacterium]
MAFALETIDYQLKDAFPGQLIELVSSIYKEIDRKKFKNTRNLIGTSAYPSQMEKLIHGRLGLNVKFMKELHVLTPAAVIPFFGDYFRHAKDMNQFKAGKFSSIFSFSHKAMEEYSQIEKHRKAQLKKLDGRKGYVDTRLARVGGYLAEVGHYLIIDFVLLKDFGLTPEETAAVICHELGHAFDGLEEHNRVETTNRSIYDVLSELNNKDYEKAVYLFKNKFTKAEFNESLLTDDKHRYDFCGQLAKAYLGEIKSQIANGKYNQTNYENMSDTFATRFGLGKELVSALAKMMAFSGAIAPNSKVLYAVLISVDIMVFAASFMVFPVWGALVFWAVIFLLHNSDTVDMTYDFPMDRFRRVKHTVVNALKRLHLPKEVLQELLDQYDFISGILEDHMDVNGLPYEIADLVLPDAREARYYSDLQKSLENSLNNELFVKSAQLKVL